MVPGPHAASIAHAAIAVESLARAAGEGVESSISMFPAVAVVSTWACAPMQRLANGSGVISLNCASDGTSRESDDSFRDGVRLVFIRSGSDRTHRSVLIGGNVSAVEPVAFERRRSAEAQRSAFQE
jgi:hypothetical protein